MLLFVFINLIIGTVSTYLLPNTEKSTTFILLSLVWYPLELWFSEWGLRTPRDPWRIARGLVIVAAAAAAAIAAVTMVTTSCPTIIKVIIFTKEFFY